MNPIVVSGFILNGGAPGFPSYPLADVALATRSTTDGDAAGHLVSWNTEVYDYGDWFVVGTGQDMNQPTVGNTSLVRIYGGAYLGNTDWATYINSRRNGSTAGYGNKGHFMVGQTGGYEWHNGVSAFIESIDWNYYSMYVTDPCLEGYFSVEQISPHTKYALLSNGGDAIAANVWEPLIWNVELRDTEGFHAGSDPHITIPSGISKVRLVANATVWFSAGNTIDYREINLRFQKVGVGDFEGIARQDGNKRVNYSGLNIASAILAVAPGDQFRVDGWSTDAGVTFGGGLQTAEGCTTWFQVEEVHPDTRYCHIRHSADQAIAAGTLTKVVMGNTVHDPENAKDGDDIVVPGGVTEVRVSYNLSSENAGGTTRVEVHVNGAHQLGMPRSSCESLVGEMLNGMGPWVPVTPGDRISLAVRSDNATTLVSTPYTWLQVEFGRPPPPEDRTGQAHRYWRVRAWDTSVNNEYMACTRLELRETPGGPDVATSATMSASVALAGYEASKANDGNDATFWTTGGSADTSGRGHTLVADFGAGNAKAINEIVYKVRPDSYREDPRHLFVESSDDGSSWRLEWFVDNLSAWTAGEVRTFTRPS